MRDAVAPDDVPGLVQGADVVRRDEPGRPDPVGRNEEVATPAAALEPRRDLGRRRAPAVVERQQQNAWLVVGDERRSAAARGDGVEVTLESRHGDRVVAGTRALEAARGHVAGDDVVIHEREERHPASSLAG